MFNKKKNRIFSILMILMFIISAGIMLKTSPKENQTNVNSNEESSSNQTIRLTEEEKAEEAAMYKESEELLSKIVSAYSNREYHMDGYGEFKNAVEINKEFLTEEYNFKQRLAFTEIEFIDYEEIKDLSEYFTKELTFDENGIDDNYNVYGFLSGLYYEFRCGMINEDGTFNKVDLVQKLIYNLDGVEEYGEEMVMYDQELMAVKLTVKVKNRSFAKNNIFINQMFEVWNLMYMDDNNLYIKDSVWARDYEQSNRITYLDMKDKFIIQDGEPDADIIVLDAREEYVGDIIFVFLKSDFETMHLLVNDGQTSDLLNFNAPDIKLISFETLKKLENNE